MNLKDLMLAPKSSIHILGVGGIGMSGLAKLLHQNNIKVQGSDINKNSQINKLRELGIKIFINHSPDNILGCSLVVKSSAIKNDNAEIIQARNKGIPVISRAELLSNMLSSAYNICVTGAHGKTSTTSLVYFMLKAINFDPTVICGGIINSINSNVYKGSDSINVVEADESDGTFMILPANISIITNIDNEHLDYYGNLQNIINVHKLFIEKALLKDLLIACDDCEKLKVINQDYLANKKHISYGIDSQNADVRAVNLKIIDAGMKFDIILSQKCQDILSQNTDTMKGIVIKNYGKHNILNALAAIIVYLFKGGDEESLNKALQLNEGVLRRFSIIGAVNGVTLIDDYAHHPSEIKATLSVAKEYSTKSKGKVIAIFQPHRYSRFKDLYKQFLESFNQADYLIVLDVYSAGESLITGYTSQIFAKNINGDITSFYCKHQMEIKDKINELSTAGDYIVFMGAGDISDIAREIYNTLS